VRGDLMPPSHTKSARRNASHSIAAKRRRTMQVPSRARAAPLTSGTRSPPSPRANAARCRRQRARAQWATLCAGRTAGCGACRVDRAACGAARPGTTHSAAPRPRSRAVGARRACGRAQRAAAVDEHAPDGLHCALVEWPVAALVSLTVPPAAAVRPGTMHSPAPRQRSRVVGALQARR
jgi:hypothetical protein